MRARMGSFADADASKGVGDSKVTTTSTKRQNRTQDLSEVRSREQENCMMEVETSGGGVEIGLGTAEVIGCPGVPETERLELRRHIG